MSSQSVKIDGATKVYGDFKACDHVSLDIQKGEFFTLLGPSGCGKTTLLRMIAGFNTIDDGKIFFGERELNSIPAHLRNIGMVFQNYAIFPHLSVKDNVAYGLKARKIKGEKLESAAREAMEMMQIEMLADRMPGQLSGGQQQRVALARILCSRPKAILLDEPFSALDGFLKWNLELELSDLLSHFNGPIVWVSHDLGECRRNCSQVCVMENGLAGRIMGLDELIRCPDSLSAARLAGYKNFFPCRACEGGVFVPDWGLTLRGISAGPEHSLLAVGPDAVDLSGKDYAFRVLRVIQDVGHNVVLLRPDGASENAPVLRIEAAPENVPQPGSILTLSLRPASLLLF